MKNFWFENMLGALIFIVFFVENKNERSGLLPKMDENKCFIWQTTKRLIKMPSLFQHIEFLLSFDLLDQSYQTSKARIP